MAGGISGNLNFLWKKVAKGDWKAVKIFLAGCGGRWDIIDEVIFGKPIYNPKIPEMNRDSDSDNREGG